MAKYQKPRWGYTASGTVNPFPLNTDWFTERPVLVAYNETSTKIEFEKHLDSIFKKVPFWVDRSDLISKIKTAYKDSGKDGFYEDEETHFIRLRKFKEELTAMAENEYEKKMELLEENLGAKLSSDDRSELNEIANEFLMNKATIDRPVTLNQSKTACEKLSKVLRNAIPVLQKLDITTKKRLCDTSEKACNFYLDSDFFIDGLSSILNASEQLRQQKASENHPLKRSSLWCFIGGLIVIYERVTNKKAGATNSEYSKFVQFAIECVSFALERKIPEILDKTDKSHISSKYSEQTINNTTVKVIAFRKERAKLENSLKDQIPLAEIQEGMLNALQKAREKNKQDELEFLKKLRK